MPHKIVHNFIKNMNLPVNLNKVKNLTMTPDISNKSSP